MLLGQARSALQAEVVGMADCMLCNGAGDFQRWGEIGYLEGGERQKTLLRRALHPAHKECRSTKGTPCCHSPAVHASSDTRHQLYLLSKKHRFSHTPDP